MLSSLANENQEKGVLDFTLNKDAQLRDVVVAPRKKQQSLYLERNREIGEYTVAREATRGKLTGSVPERDKHVQVS